MFKFLLILILIVFVLYKVGSFFFRIGAASQQFRNVNQQQQKKASGANGKSDSGRTGKFTGGEYIDYEEVKK
ncbi:MAG TPA: hypothetical protein VKZ68_04995 [Ohtaekwangia sp.]|nr:hypothetical protein [Ohtaekwangia sp.]